MTWTTTDYSTMNVQGAKSCVDQCIANVFLKIGKLMSRIRICVVLERQVGFEL